MSKSLLPFLPFLDMFDLDIFNRGSKERPLTKIDIRDIILYRQDGKSAGWIARDMKLNQVTVARIIREAKAKGIKV